MSVKVKVCPKCKQEKPEWGFKPRCKNCDECNSKYRQRDNADARKRASWAHGLRKIGATPEMYEEMHENQGGACAICRKPEQDGKRLAMDHDHATGEIRGLLCRNCNVALGLLGDDIELLKSATGYLMARNS